jgi:hypothetical protein
MSGTIKTTSATGTLITFALISGVVMISAVMTFMILSNPPEDQSLLRVDGDAMLFLGIGYVAFLGGALAAVILRSQLKGRAIEKLRASHEPLPRPLEGDSPLPQSGQSFLGEVATFTLIGQAVLEGPAIINAIFMLMENNFAHAIPIVIAILWIAAQIPTVDKIKMMMEDAKL